MGIRDFLNDPAGRRSIKEAIRGAFARRRGAAGGKGRILVIDADPLTREGLVKILESAGYDVAGVPDDDQVRSRLGQADFDLVISDLSTSGGDGLELVGLASSQGREPSPDADRWSGASHTLVRPFDTEQLLQAIERVLNA